MSALRYLRGVSQKFHANRDRFRALFGFDLINVWDPVTGLDVVQFDRLLKVPAGKSTEQVIKTRFGKEAVTFIRGLL